ncbi:MAG TPA: hypothetical protein VM029_14880 [Opitutaceae bacterium]|nr:hypothetical protein [Opitutaceae bacterium]
MSRIAAFASLCLLPLLAAAADANRPTLIVVAGAPGEAEFAQPFQEQLTSWAKIGGQAGVTTIVIGGDENPATPDRDRLKQVLDAEPKSGPAEFWLILLGHGTFDGKEAKFNLRGADFSATELTEWLKPMQRPLALIDTSSSSAPFLAKLAGKNRVVVTSTRSGYQQNYSRFGKYFTEAIADTKADLDKDGQVSLLEGFLGAAHRTAEFYKTEGRLATEHALIDDNGDGLGTPADWFKGVRAVRRAQDSAPLDGTRAHQFHLVRTAAEQQLPPEVRARRDALELEVAKLRDAKAKMTEDAYYKQLEKLLLQLAALYETT